MHYERTLRAQGLQDKHSAQRVREAVRTVRENADIAQFMTREEEAEAEMPPLSRSARAQPHDHVEQRRKQGNWLVLTFSQGSSEQLHLIAVRGIPSVRS